MRPTYAYDISDCTNMHVPVLVLHACCAARAVAETLVSQVSMYGVHAAQPSPILIRRDGCSGSMRMPRDHSNMSLSSSSSKSSSSSS
eukprot:gene8428-biopygen14659